VTAVKTRLLCARLMARDYFVSRSWARHLGVGMGQASRSRKGRAMITLSCEEVRREISNYLDDDISPHMRRLLGGAGWARDLSIKFL
jgi:hypothetical protein